MNLFDTHCHLDVEEFDEDREQVIARCKSLGVNHILLPAITRNTWDRLLTLANSDAMFYPSLGLHPYYLAEHREQHIADLRYYLELNKNIVAIGEIGLDYFVTELDQQTQIVFFEQQLQLAKDFNLPVILHVRKAHDQVLQLLRKYKITRGIAHAYSGSEQQAMQFYDQGLKLGFGGPVTYERANKLRRLIKALPQDAFVLETDAPDLSPALYKGQRNSPEYLPDILRVVAELREEEASLVASYTSATADELLGRKRV